MATTQRTPDKLNGNAIYNEILGCGGENIDYFRPKLIKYTWDDFSDLVCYEKSMFMNHDYSSQLAVNLLKGTLARKRYYYPDIMNYTQGEVFNIFLTYVHMKVRMVIPQWDLERGYFDKYFEKYVHDAIRQLMADVTGITNEIIEEKIEGKKTPVKHISKATSLNIETDESSNFMDSLEHKAMTSPDAHKMINLNDYSSPETHIFHNPNNEENGIKAMLGLLGEYDNFSVSNELAVSMTFFEKFLNRDILNNSQVANQLLPKISSVFKESLLSAENDKLVKEEKERLKAAQNKKDIEITDDFDIMEEDDEEVEEKVSIDIDESDDVEVDEVNEIDEVDDELELEA